MRSKVKAGHSYNNNNNNNNTRLASMYTAFVLWMLLPAPRNAAWGHIIRGALIWRESPTWLNYSSKERSLRLLPPSTVLKNKAKQVIQVHRQHSQRRIRSRGGGQSASASSVPTSKFSTIQLMASSLTLLGNLFLMLLGFFWDLKCGELSLNRIFLFNCCSSDTVILYFCDRFVSNRHFLS